MESKGNNVAKNQGYYNTNDDNNYSDSSNNS